MAFFGVILMKSGDACPADYFREAFFGRSKSFLRQKARAQKARKLGLSGLSASFPYMNFAILKRRNYVKIQVPIENFPPGETIRTYARCCTRGWGKTDSVLPKNGSQTR